jgi:hypothetical protein
MAVLWLRRLVTELSPRRSGFAPGSVHVENTVALGQICLYFIGFPLSISLHHVSPCSYIT